MCQRIAASLACIALVFGASRALAEEGRAPVPHITPTVPIDPAAPRPRIPGELGQMRELNQHLGDKIDYLEKKLSEVESHAQSHAASHAEWTAESEHVPGRYLPPPAPNPQPPFTQPTPLYAPQPVPTLQPGPQYYAPAIAPVAPSAPSAYSHPGSFSIVANGDRPILLDTHNGDTWRLANAAGGPKWVVIEREKKANPHEEIIDSFIDPEMIKPADSPHPAPAVVKADDPFAVPVDPQSVIDRESDVIRKLPEGRQRDAEMGSRKVAQRMSELVDRVNHHAREARIASEKLAKSEKANQTLLKKLNEFADKVDELEKQLAPQPKE